MENLSAGERNYAELLVAAMERNDEKYSNSAGNATSFADEGIDQADVQSLVKAMDN